MTLNQEKQICIFFLMNKVQTFFLCLDPSEPRPGA